MKDLKITAPKGYEIDKEKSTFENIVFKELNKLPKTWKELGSIGGFYLSSTSKICIGYYEAEFGNENIFKTREQANAALARALFSF
jgi:hypothetical protein